MRVAPLCVLLGAGGLWGCAWRDEPPGASIKDRAPAATRRLPTKGATTARPPQPRQQAAPAQDGRGCQDVQACEAQLRALVERRDRAWMRRPETPAEVLTGVRMFAFRALRPQLTCGELDVALEQLAAVPTALRTPPPDSRPEEVARATRLAAEVHSELGAEKETRCAAAPTRTRQPERSPPASPPQAPPAPPPPASSEPAQPQPQPQPPPAPPAKGEPKQ